MIGLGSGEMGTIFWVSAGEPIGYSTRMKFAIFSDLHIDQVLRHGSKPAPLSVDADAVILAGDIHRTTQGLRWARERWPDLPMVYVPGNHEFYGSHLFGMLSEMRKVAAGVDIYLLSNNAVVLGDTRILGTILWTNFALSGTAAESARVAERFINDFRVIRENAGPLTSRTMTRLNSEARAFLREELKKPWDGKTVIVTHWLTHPECIIAKYRGSELSPYFCCDCSDLLIEFKIDLWVYGHSHGSGDFVHPHGCRIVSNQRGYPHECSVVNGFRSDCCR